MSRKFLIAMVFVLFLFSACSKGSTTTDADSGESLDGDTIEDMDVASDESSDSVNDASDESHDSDVEVSVCQPNPCDTTANQEAHRTRCLPNSDEDLGYECLCDTEGHYHESDGICCPPYSNNEEGKCECVSYYTHPADDPEACVAICGEDTIEGLNGYCPEGEVCQQGKCIEDLCADFVCPKDSTCSIKSDAPFCLCDDGLHMTNGMCCQEHSTANGGLCECDTGFKDDGSGVCIPEAGNKCFPVNPCETGPLHKDKCIPDASVDGYHCECNENYEPSGDACSLIEVAVCPGALQCLNGYCLPLDLSNEQCVIDDHCQEFPGATTTCTAPGAAGGICSGCTVASDCPGETQCMDNGYGTCALMCDDDIDCPYGKCYVSGYCGQARCYSNEDCFGGSICIDESGDGSGMCQRIPCAETACSITNPGGSCVGAGEACIEGKCVANCASDTCSGVNTECKELLGVPSCACVEGTTANSAGDCLPDIVTSCPGGFSCVQQRCVDSSDSGFVCGEDSDCGASEMSCSNALPSGSCQGCYYPADCPGTGTISPFDCVGADIPTSHPGYCMKKCSTHAECGVGMVCKTGVGGDYCAKTNCLAPTDCPNNYTCSLTGRCERLPCK